MVDYLLLGLGIILLLLGFLGCLIPILPGPPISFLGLLTLEFTRWGPVPEDMLWTLGFGALLVTLLDYIVPIWGTKKFGGSRFGIWGASIGLVIGLFFGPLGILLGPFLGAFLGELSQRSESDKALKAALGSLVGFFMGIGLKLIASGFISWYFFKELLNG